MSLLSRIFGPPLPAISATDASEKLKGAKRPFLVDVRQPGEFSGGHIVGAKLIPLGELPARMKELPRDKEIICVCASGNRSRSATRALVRAGYSAINLNGGMFAWRRAGLPIKKS